MNIGLVKFVPLLPAAAMVLCGLLGCTRALRRYSAAVLIASMLAALALVLMTWSAMGDPASYMQRTTHADRVVTLFEWIGVADFSAAFGFYIDPLTMIMLLVITVVGSMIAIYASGYMQGDPGYFRFFAYVGLFIFSMCCVVMSDNLLLLYLGWEGVGVASFLLIGFYYHKPSAVAAAKKAFIVNRIGDLGFALGIMLTYLTFGSVRYDAILPAAQALLGQVDPATLSAAALAAHDRAADAGATVVQIIPFLLMLGALGKSAQIPLYVWLPDAMEGPTPVSALIHAATMVTSGVYMIARLLPIFQFSPYALPTVAVIGGVTALFAASIAIAQNDLKRVFAYSTVSQLGYMFLGVGVLSTVGGMFHLTTHAFFKALLFLTAGNVMHAMAGQLDLRKMSGLRTRMPLTCGLMLVGCLSLSGFPFTSGFMSKDLILGDALARGAGPHGEALYIVLAFIGLATAFLTATYAFRVWFRVFMGPTRYEMGAEHHAHAEDTEREAAADPHRAPATAESHEAHPATHGHHAEPHEVNWLFNGPLVILALGSLGYGAIAYYSGWIQSMVLNSTARPLSEAPHEPFLGVDPHLLMLVLSSVVALAAIAVAAYFHWLNRPAAARLADRYPALVRTLANSYYVNEIYDAMLHGVTSYGDAPSISSGVVEAAEDGYRGATLAVFALAGFLPGLVAPLLIGIVLQAAGGIGSSTAWTWAFVVLAMGSVVSAAAMRLARRPT